MKVKLEKKINKNATIIGGFPGIGLIGTITSEFLLEHLDAEFVGHFEYDEFPPTVAIHKGKLIHPMGIFYDKKKNIVIMHTIMNTNTLEWKISNAILNFYKDIQAKEIIFIEGIGSANEQEKPEPNPDVFFYTNNDQKKLEKLGLKPLMESIIVGMTSSLLLKTKTEKLTCLFGQSHANLPDSKGAAKMIELLDKILGLDVDYKPLLKQAEIFETKIKGLLEKAKKTGQDKVKQQLNYVG